MHFGKVGSLIRALQVRTGAMLEPCYDTLEVPKKFHTSRRKEAVRACEFHFRSQILVRNGAKWSMTCYQGIALNRKRADKGTFGCLIDLVHINSSL